MREESKNWLAQAEADLNKADVLFKAESYDGAVFFYQQSVEKALKSLAATKLQEIPRGHSIIYLAKMLEVPETFLSGIRDLNPEYLITRYPDMAEGIPAEIYDKQISSRHKKTAEGVLEWVKSQMK